MTPQQQADYDEFIRTQPNDGHRAAEAIGMVPIDPPIDPDTGRPNDPPPGTKWDNAQGRWVSNAANGPGPNGAEPSNASSGNNSGSLSPEQRQKYDDYVKANPNLVGGRDFGQKAGEALGFRIPLSVSGQTEVDAGKRDPADLRMSRMIDRDRPSWEAYLTAHWPAGLPLDPGAIEGVIRQMSYAVNDTGGAAGNAQTYLDRALETANRRAASGGDRSVDGNYNTDWNDADPARTGGKDPSAAYTTAMNNLQTQMDAPGTTLAQRNALQTQMAAMFNGAYAGPPAPVSTIGAITPAAPTAPTVPTNTAAAAPSPQPTTPYSARQAVPTSAVPPVQASPVPAAMPATATMANMMTPQNPYAAQTPYAAQNPYAAARQFGYTNDVYDRSLQGTGFARAPWAGTRDQLARGPMAPSPIDPSTGMPDTRDRRRAYQFGAQDAANNQRDATLGQQDFNGQMNNWLKAYNDWNRRGADPLAPPTGGV